MKSIGKILIGLVFTFSVNTVVFASDWDVAGKVLTGIEGLRIITGGKVDLIGNIAGINNNRNPGGNRIYSYARYQYNYCEPIWVSHYVWKKKWIPGHYEYRKRERRVFIPGHYVKYKVERGGHWINRCY